MSHQPTEGPESIHIAIMIGRIPNGTLATRSEPMKNALLAAARDGVSRVEPAKLARLMQEHHRGGINTRAEEKRQGDRVKK